MCHDISPATISQKQHDNNKLRRDPKKTTRKRFVTEGAKNHTSLWSTQQIVSIYL